MEERRIAESQALTNYDLAKLSASGASDDVIILAIRDRGGRFDVSPDGIVQLKAIRVSDRVIAAAQQAPRPAPVMSAPSDAYYPADPMPEIALVSSVVIGPPRPLCLRSSSGDRGGFGVRTGGVPGRCIRVRASTVRGGSPV